MSEIAPIISCYLFLTEDCNLKCKYCFENASRCNNNYMSEDIAEKSIDFLIDNALKHGDKNLTLTFFGGEPLLNLDVMIKLLHYAVDRAKQNNIGLSFSLITNGTIYNKQYEEFILEWNKATNNVNIQISTDGIPEVQDKNRRTVNDQPTSEIVFKNIIKLKTFLEENNICLSSFFIHSVVTKDSVSKLFSSYKYFKQLGVKYSEFVLANEEDWNENDISTYIEQMSLISDYIYEECISLDSLKPYKDAKGIISLRTSEVYKTTCSAGKSFCAITTNGDIYACHRTYSLNRSFKMGDIFDGIIDNVNEQSICQACRSDMNVDNVSCSKCENPECIICMAYNYEKYGDVQKCSPSVCSMYKAKWKFMIETKKKFDKLSHKLSYNKCNEMTFVKAIN